MTDDHEPAADAFDITSLARKLVPSAMKELGVLATEATSEASRIAAIKEVLALACGKGASPAEEESITVVFVDDWAQDSNSQ
jgi:hypothetical protein